MSSAIMPGTVLKKEMEEHGQTQADLAFILGRQQSEISALIAGKKSISPEIARELAVVFSKDAQYWLNLEAAYVLTKTEFDEASVTKRLKLYGSYPIRDMIKRGWIEPSEDIATLEKRVCDFLGITSITDHPQINHAARKSTSYLNMTPAQAAWIVRVRQMANYVHAEKFSDKALGEALEKLHLLLKDAEEVRHIPRILADAGIRFVIVEALPSTRIDGVSTWLDKTSPVIGLSLRFDRIDTLWHTLFHEIHHIKEREGQESPMLDVDMVGEDRETKNLKPENEEKADAFAANSSVKQSDLDGFISRVRPLYSTMRIKAFAATKQLHPGVVVGQLQHRGEIPYSHNRDLLVKVRHLITESALTDGWGYKPSIKPQ